MKPTMLKIASAALVCLMLFSLASCSSDKSSAVEKAFTDEGYEVSKSDANNETVKPLLGLLLNEEQMESVSEYEFMLCVPEGLLNVGNTAIVIKFPSAGDLKEFLTTEKDGEKDTSTYDKAKEDGNINGNCLLITAGSEARDIFKKA